jgi:hypothetical protein
VRWLPVIRVCVHKRFLKSTTGSQRCFYAKISFYAAITSVKILSSLNRAFFDARPSFTTTREEKR